MARVIEAFQGGRRLLEPGELGDASDSKGGRKSCDAVEPVEDEDVLGMESSEVGRRLDDATSPTEVWEESFIEEVTMVM